jgi:hypothetical protein
LARSEISDASKALELRIREATGFVTAYTFGKLNPKEADERHARFYHRWGESLPGISVSEGMTDADILAAIDRAAESAEGSYQTPGEIHASYVSRLGKAAKRAPKASR